MRLPNYEVLVGDVRAACETLLRQGRKVDLVFTSPPYWPAKRDYHHDGQLGHEPTSEEFVQVMVDIFATYVKPLMKDTASLYLNIDDAYVGAGSPSNRPGLVRPDRKGPFRRGHVQTELGYKRLDLYSIPERIFTGLQQRGFTYRAQVIWAKTNGLPQPIDTTAWVRHRRKIKAAEFHHSPRDAGQSFMNNVSGAIKARWENCPGCEQCRDGWVMHWGNGRPARRYEPIGFLTMPRYYWDREAVRQVYAEATLQRRYYQTNLFGADGAMAGRSEDATGDPTYPLDGPNLQGIWEGVDPTDLNDWLARYYPEVLAEFNGQHEDLSDLWATPHAQYGGLHLAQFPEVLPELAIKASTSEGGCCPECGAPLCRQLEQELVERDDKEFYLYHTVGWRPTCYCQFDAPVPAVVFDPFNGAGTTGLVANRLGRDYLGSEINPDYATATGARIEEDAPLFYVEPEIEDETG